MEESNSQKIRVLLISSESCKICQDVYDDLWRYNNTNNNIDLKVVDASEMEDSEKCCVITPALWVNDSLWYFGSFDMNRFDEKIKMLMV